MENNQASMAEVDWARDVKMAITIDVPMCQMRAKTQIYENWIYYVSKTMDLNFVCCDNAMEY